VAEEDKESKLSVIKDMVTEYALLACLIGLVGWLAVKHTGTGTNELSPQFWAGVALPLFGQLIRKAFDLKKPEVK
jgi:hypothetical protein